MTNNITIMNWVINLLIFSLPFSWYLSYTMYKDLKNKDHVIRVLENIIKQNEDKK